MTLDSVEYPAMREEVKYAVCALSDESFQHRVWGRGRPPNERCLYDFDEAFHTLLDDIDVYSDAEVLIGKIFVNEMELKAIQDLGASLLDVVAQTGRLGSFEQARASRLWPAVIDRAHRALTVIGMPADFP